MIHLIVMILFLGTLSGIAHADENVNPNPGGTDVTTEQSPQESKGKRAEPLSKEKRSKVIEITKKLPEESGAPILGSKLEILEDAKDVLDLFSTD